MSKLLKYDDFLTLDEATGTYTMSQEQKVRDETERNRWKDIGLSILKDWRLYLMLVPMLVVYVLWRYMPMTELLAAFKDPNTIGATDVSQWYWNGLTNFVDLFFGAQSSLFWGAFRNTFIIAFYGLLFGFPFPIILALFFNEIKSNIARSIMQVCVYLPKFMSTVIITALTIVLFRGRNIGVLSQALTAIFGANSSIGKTAALEWGLLFSDRYFRGIYQIVGIWEHGGYDSIVFFAAVIAVSPTSYEAAQIDGAGKMQQMRYVVIPSILSTVVIMLIMKVGTLLSVGYEKVLLMKNGENQLSAEIVATLSNSWAGGANQTLGVAAEMVNNLIGMILVIGANMVARKATDVSLY